MAGRIFSVFYTSTSSRSIKTQKKKKKELRQYLAILTSRFINNAYLSIVFHSTFLQVFNSLSELVILEY